MTYNFGVKVSLKDPDDFLLVKETLTRLGIGSEKNKTLWQSCNLLHKKGEYYICHFKEMFKLDGNFSDITEEDISRRNLITKLLQDWGLLTVLEPEKMMFYAPMSSLKIISHKDKENWKLVQKYTVGSEKNKPLHRNYNQ